MIANMLVTTGISLW